MKKLLLVLLSFNLCFLSLSNCPKEYSNESWKLKACINEDWYPKVETQESITFFGDSIYYLKINKELRSNGNLPIKDLLATHFTKQINKGHILTQIDSTSPNTFVASYLSTDSILETSFGIKSTDNTFLFFEYVKRYNSLHTHKTLIEFIDKLLIETTKNESKNFNDESEKFRTELEDFIFNYDPEHKIQMNKDVWEELNNLEPKSQKESFDFISYWKKSLKEFCVKISTYKNPKISHYNLTPDKKQDGFPQLYLGELFISSDESEILKCRFSAMKWKSKIYLMNITVLE